MIREIGKQRTSLGLIVAFSGIGVLTFPTPVQAEDVETLMEEKDGVDDEIKSIQRETEKTERKIDRMERRFERTEVRIADTEEDIEKTKERIESRRELIGQRLSSLQSTGGAGSFLEVLFDSRDFGDFINRVSAVNSIMDSDKRLIDSQNEDQALLEERVVELTDRKESLQSQFREMQEKLTELEAQKAEQELMLLDLEGKIEDAKERAYWERFAKLQQRKFAQLPIEDLGSAYEELTDEEKEHVDFDETLYEKQQKIIEDTIDEASKYLGGTYVWGGSNPQTSFDCSGLTQWSFKQAGVELPRTAAQQYLATDRVAASDVRVGDLVFFSYGKGISHVGIYVGDGKMLNAQNSGIKIADLSGYWEQYLVGFGRAPGL